MATTAKQLLDRAQKRAEESRETVTLDEWGDVVIRTVSAAEYYKLLQEMAQATPDMVVGTTASWLVAGVVDPKMDIDTAMKLARTEAAPYLRLVQAIRGKAEGGTSFEMFCLQVLDRAGGGLGVLAQAYRHVKDGGELLAFLRHVVDRDKELTAEGAEVVAEELLREEWEARVGEAKNDLEPEATSSSGEPA